MRMTCWAAVCAMAFAGCATVSTGGLEASVADKCGLHDIRMDDSWIAARLSVEDAVVRRNDSGFAVAQFTLRNRNKRDLPIQFKFRFFDADGIEIQQGARAWEQTTLHGGESANLTAVAPEMSASSFKLRVRRVN